MNKRLFSLGLPSLPPIWRIRIALFLAGSTTFSLLYSPQAILPQLAEGFGVSAAASALSISVGTIGLAIAIFCSSILSGSCTRKALMLYSLLTASLLSLCGIHTSNWNIFVFFRFLSGVALGGVPSIALVYLAEELPPAQLGAATGIYVAGNAFGGMSGRIIISLITEHIGWQHALDLLGGYSVLSSLAFAALLPASRHFTKETSINLRYHFHAYVQQIIHPVLRWMYILPFTIMGVFVSVYNYIGFRLLGPEFHLSQTQVGLLFGIYVFGMVSSTIAGYLSDRMGQPKVIVAGIATILVGLLCSLTGILPGILLGLIIVTLGFFISHAAASAWVGQLGGQQRSHAAALYLLFYYFGSAVMGWLSGWFWQHAQWFGVVAFCGGFTLCALVIAVYLYTATRAPQATSNHHTSHPIGRDNAN